MNAVKSAQVSEVDLRIIPFQGPTMVSSIMLVKLGHIFASLGEIGFEFIRNLNMETASTQAIIIQKQQTQIRTALSLNPADLSSFPKWY